MKEEKQPRIKKRGEENSAVLKIYRSIYLFI